MSDSSSFHSLNADRGLPRLWGKAAYLGGNAVRDIMPELPWRRTSWSRFAPRGITREQWDGLVQDVHASVGRKWSNLFWSQFPWDNLSDEIGPLNILDVGCGRGGYALRFVAWAESSMASYRGVEPSLKYESQWRSIHEQDERCSFVNADAEHAMDVIGVKTNLIVSQSALEHIPGDVQLMRDIAEWSETVTHPIVQIHLVPAGISLPLYLFHGIRQYPLRSLRSLTAPLTAHGWSARYIGLGGWASVRAHWQTVTLPQLILRGVQRTSEAGYPETSWRAFNDDIAHPLGPPLFWAIIATKGWTGEALNTINGESGEAHAR